MEFIISSRSSKRYVAGLVWLLGVSMAFAPEQAMSSNLSQAGVEKYVVALNEVNEPPGQSSVAVPLIDNTNNPSKKDAKAADTKKSSDEPAAAEGEEKSSGSHKVLYTGLAVGAAVLVGVGIAAGGSSSSSSTKTLSEACRA